MPGTPPKVIKVCRMVHIDNVKHVLMFGMCTSTHKNADPSYINIGDSSLIAQRKEYEIPVPPGGMLGEYVPFYFGGHSPMLLNIKTGHRGIKERRQSEIVYFVCRVDDLVKQCSEWVFTDGHAKDAFTSFYNNIEELPGVIDWPIVYDQYWRNTEDDYDRQRRKQAEFLIKSHVPVSCVCTIIVKTGAREQQIIKMLSDLNLAIPVKIDTKNQLYYP